MQRTAAFTGLLFILAGCGDGGDPCGEPLYEGEATDEAWRTMVDGELRAMVGDPSAPDITAPSEGAHFVGSGTPPIFTWTSPIASLAPGTPPGPDDPSIGEQLASLFVGTAHAHLPPITGDVYYIQIDTPGEECAYRVLTTNLDWQVNQEAWDRFRAAAGQPNSIRMLSAYLTENRITEGPFAPASPRVFTVDP